MRTIKELVDQSRQYHGALDPETKTCSLYYYNSPSGEYRCAIGCNLENPLAFQQVLSQWGEYNIGHLIRYRNSEFRERGYLGDPVLKAIFSKRLGPLAAKLQAIHDDAKTVRDYLAKLDEWEAEGFNLNFKTDAL